MTFSIKAEHKNSKTDDKKFIEKTDCLLNGHVNNLDVHIDYFEDINIDR